MKRNVLFISSTGGHLNELMQLSPMFEKYDYHIITEKTKSNLNLKEKSQRQKYTNLQFVYFCAGDRGDFWNFYIVINF